MIEEGLSAFTKYHKNCIAQIDIIEFPEENATCYHVSTNMRKTFDEKLEEVKE